MLATGALLCLRSLYRRAQRIGALGRFRYAVLRAEDYVLGTAEEEIRRSVRAVAALPGARVIVLYLSCLDILTRPDFADMEQRLSAETGCIVRCFFRGPLAKADGITHELVKDLPWYRRALVALSLRSLRRTKVEPSITPQEEPDGT